MAGRGLVAEREHRGIHEVLDIAETGDGATSVDQQHVAGADRACDLADDIDRAGPVYGRRAQYHGVQRVLGFNAADLGLGVELRLRIPVAKPRRRMGLVDRAPPG